MPYAIKKISRSTHKKLLMNDSGATKTRNVGQNYCVCIALLAMTSIFISSECRGRAKGAMQIPHAAAVAGRVIFRANTSHVNHSGSSRNNMHALADS